MILTELRQDVSHLVSHILLLFPLFIITELIIPWGLSTVRSFVFALSPKRQNEGIFSSTGRGEPQLLGRSQCTAGLAVLLRPAACEDILCSALTVLLAGEGRGRHPAGICKGPAEPQLTSGKLCEHPAVHTGVRGGLCSDRC